MSHSREALFPEQENMISIHRKFCRTACCAWSDKTGCGASFNPDNEGKCLWSLAKIEEKTRQLKMEGKFK